VYKSFGNTDPVDAMTQCNSNQSVPVSAIVTCNITAHALGVLPILVALFNLHGVGVVPKTRGNFHGAVLFTDGLQGSHELMLHLV
jgi:hypothetical protein